MPTWIQRHPLAFALSVLAALLAALIAIELAMGGSAAAILGAPPKRATAADAKLLPPLVAAAPEQAYPEMVTRPLFTPTRRPAPEAPPQAAVVRGQFILLGTTVAGQTRIALLREKSSGRIHRVESGASVNGIRISQINPESVTLAHGSEDEVLSLQVQRPAGAPGSPGAATAPGGLGGGPFAASSAGGSAPPGSPPSGNPLPVGVPAQPAGAAPPPPPGAQSLAAPGGSFMPPSVSVANPSSAAVPQSASSPMSPEELLARRRARRAQQTE
jgi:general secretion pathway protein N